MSKTILITGGAGFIGTNLAIHHMHQDDRVIIYDNCFREGVEKNIEFLKTIGNDQNLDIRIASILDLNPLIKAVEEADIIYHEAGQTAVTTSLIDQKQILK